MRPSSGFTLIELLVVIGIIAILVILVLASIFISRQRAVDTQLLNDVREIRLVIEEKNSGLTNYGYALQETLIDPNPAEQALLGDLRSVYGDENISSAVSYAPSFISVPDDQPNAFCMSFRRIVDSSQFYCIDSSELSVQLTNQPCDTEALKCQ